MYQLLSSVSHRTHYPRPAAFAAALFAVALLAPPGPAQPAPAQEPADVVGPVNLPGDSLDALLGLLERWTGKDLLRAQGLPNVTLTFVLKERLPRAQAVQALETLLSLNGIGITPLGDRFLKITPIGIAKSEVPDFIDGSTLSLPPSGRVATKLFQLQFLQVAEFMPQIAVLLNPGAGSPPMLFDKANAALITDSVSTLQRIETLVGRLDRPVLSSTEPKFYQLQYANASDVVNKLRTILSGTLQNQLGSATTYNADDRTNQIVLVTDPRQHAFFDSLISRLDVRSDPNTRNEVIYLKHGAADDVATVLTQLVTGQMSATRSRQGEGRSRLREQPPPRAAAESPPPGTPPPPPAPIGPPTPAALGLSLDETKQFSALLTIIPEERTNAIIVSGTRDDIRLIEELVAKIDTLLAQVRIEVVIAEVTLGDDAISGISALGLRIAGDKLVGFDGAGPGIVVTDGFITSPGVVGAGPYDLAAQISLATTPRKSIANILSVPNIVTTHNKKGRIFVGEMRPVISSYLHEGVGPGVPGGGYRSTVSQQEIGIDLEVLPLIGSDGSVQLEIVQTVDDVLGEITIDGNPQPRIGKRETESFVSARSGEVIVLGGLQRTSDTRSTSRLGPVPILGDLLGTRTRGRTRTDLVFFLRPTILTNTPADNAPALRQIEQLPARQRDPIKEAVGATAAPGP